MENGLFEVSQNIVIASGDNVLILNKDGKYLLPGGRIQANESWEQALRREVSEETGITDFVITKVAEVSSSDDNKKIILTFVGLTNTKDVRLSREHESFKWVNKNELDNYDFWHPSIKERILKALETS